MSRRGRHNRHHGPRNTDALGEQAARSLAPEGQPIAGAETTRDAIPDPGRSAAPVIEPAAAVVTAPGPRPQAPERVQPSAAPVPDARPTPPAATSITDAMAGGPGTGAPYAAASAEPPRPTCTTAQLRRFIKSRPWIPMHELRRRFGIMGGDDDVTPVRVGEHTLFIGLPPAEGRLMGELLASGDVGYELSLDPITPIVVGVYPMRPVPRG
jgi:hypothetical protein